MKLFPYCQDNPKYCKLTIELQEVIFEAVHQINRITKKHQCIQIAMFVVHAHAKLISYHLFDRFVYAQAAIVLATKIIDQTLQVPAIVKEFRCVLRKYRGRKGQDCQGKIHNQTTKVKQAQTNLIISMGFDMNLTCGATYITSWGKSIGQSDFLSQVSKKLTNLYRTTICLYYQPEIMALTGIFMAIQSLQLTPELCGWSPQFYSKYMSSKDKINEAYREYTNRINN